MGFMTRDPTQGQVKRGLSLASRVSRASFNALDSGINKYIPSVEGLRRVVLMTPRDIVHPDRLFMNGHFQVVRIPSFSLTAPRADVIDLFWHSDSHSEWPCPRSFEPTLLQRHTIPLLFPKRYADIGGGAGWNALQCKGLRPACPPRTAESLEAVCCSLLPR